MEQRACQPHAPTVAPTWHTLLLLGWLLGAALLGATLGAEPAPSSGPRIWSAYLPLALAALSLALFATRLGLGRSILGSLWGYAARGPAATATEIALGVATFALVLGVESALAPDRSPSVRALLPTSTSEQIAWIATSVVVGTAEELIYRGYLLRQLSAWLEPCTGAALQAALFAFAHLDQGPAAALRIGGYGLLFGALTVTRGSLTAGVVAHVLINCYAGLVG